MKNFFNFNLNKKDKSTFSNLITIVLLAILSISLLIGSFYIEWRAPSLPFMSNIIIKVTKKQNVIEYPYCSLIEISKNKLTCIFLDQFLLDSKIITRTPILKEKKIPYMTLNIRENTKIFYNNLKISDKDLNNLNIPQEGIPIKLQIVIQSQKPRLTAKNIYNHIVYLLKNKKKQPRPYHINSINISKIPKPEEFFKNANTLKYLNYLKKKNEIAKKLTVQNNDTSLRQIRCTLNKCTFIKDSQPNNIQVYNLLKKYNYPLSDFLVYYCKQANNNTTIQKGLFASQKTYTGIEAVELLTEPNAFIDCKNMPPKIKIDEDFIKLLAYSVYYNTELSPAKPKLLLHTMSIPIITKTAQTNQTAKIEYIYDLRINQLFTIFVDKLINKYSQSSH